MYYQEMKIQHNLLDVIVVLDPTAFPSSEHVIKKAFNVANPITV